MDAITGEPVDFDALRIAEMRARRARFGALVPALATTIARVSEDAMIAVDVLAALGPSELEGEALRRELERAGARVMRLDGSLASIEGNAAGAPRARARLAH